MEKQSSKAQAQQQSIDELIEQYINEMTEMEKTVMEIAKDHLGSSFSIEYSVGFITWIREKNKQK